MKFIITISLVFSIFFAVYAIKTPNFDFYYYYFVVIFLLPFLVIKYGKVPIKVINFFVIILFLGFINVIFNNSTMSNTLKYWLGPFILYLFYYYVIAYYKFSFKGVFKIYLKSAYVISVIGLIQVVSHKIGFESGYNFSWLGQERSYGDSILMESTNFAGLYPIHSIFSEPSHFGQALSAAIFFSLISLFNPILLNKFQAIIILIASILTQSSTTYFAIFISVLLLIYNFISFRNLIFATIVIYFGGILLYSNVEKFKDRFDSIFLLTGSGLNNNNINDIDGSSLILANHFYVAYENLKAHPIIGTGIGSHEFAHKLYSLTKGMYVDVLNIHDASSMFNRIMSEFGLTGLLFTAFFVVFYYNKRTKGNNLNHINLNWVYNNASLVTIFVFLLRQGHFFIYGFPLFVLVYYFTGKYKNYVVN